METPAVNILWIVSDTFRWDYIGAYGNDWIRTPHLDKLAQESLLYDEAFAEGLPTVPARRVMFTGRPIFPWEFRPMKSDSVHLYGWHSLYEEDETISEYLREQHDYVTCLVNDCYHLMKPGKNFNRGFDCWYWVRGQEADPFAVPNRDHIEHLLEAMSPDRRIPDRAWVIPYLNQRVQWTSDADTHVGQTMIKAADWLTEYRGARPFYLHVECFDPHEPWDPPAEFARQYKPDYPDPCTDGIIPPLHTTDMTPEAVANVKAAYAGNCTLVDKWVGHLLDTLRETGRMDDTLVVFTSDHGGMMGEQDELHKLDDRLRNQATQLPLMIRHPKGDLAGQHVKGFVQHQDIMPTVLNLAGLPIPDRVLGRDAWPTTADPKTEPQEIVSAFGPFACIRNHEWNYMQPWTDEELVGKQSSRDGVVPRYDLYDLKSDPQELTNVLDQHKDLAGEMAERLKAHMDRLAPLTGGSLDAGRVEASQMSRDCVLPIFDDEE